MSSLSCVLSKPAIDDPRPLLDAMIGVAELSFFSIGEPVADAAAVVLPGGGWYEAIVAFDGPARGHARFVLPGGLSRELFTEFLGLDSADAIQEAALRDLVGEFANMACGAWLTGLNEASCSTIAHPEVRLLPGAPPPGGLVVLINGQPVVVTVGSDTSLA